MGGLLVHPRYSVDDDVQWFVEASVARDNPFDRCSYVPAQVLVEMAYEIYGPPAWDVHIWLH